jgi:predicted TIM-barrel fold metal-dependent hydrolase
VEEDQPPRLLFAIRWQPGDGKRAARDMRRQAQEHTSVTADGMPH